MPTLHWQKSSFSGDPNTNCLELAPSGDGVLIRESEAPGFILTASRTGLAAFLRGIKADDFDHRLS
jgi:hypothetical protein